jgi:DNA ligase-1
MYFSVFTEYLQRLEKISSRLEITAILAELFQKLENDEIEEACYLMQGQLLPPYEEAEFQIAVKTVIKALARVLPVEEVETQTLFADPDFSAQEKKVETLYRKLGDLGLAAEDILSQAKETGNKSTIREVYKQLFDLAQDSGAQSQQRKLDSLVSLLQKLQPISAKFVIRIILGSLRLGFSDMTMIDALSWAMTGTKDERTDLEEAYQKKADIGKLAHFYLGQKDAEKRKQALANYTLEVGVPVIPALCQRLNSAGEMIEKMHDVIAEPKYDGLRVQIHVNKEKKPQFKTFTRNLEETSLMFPELQQALSDLKCTTCILDAEAVGYDPQDGELLPFQYTMQRKRKHDIDEKAKEIPVRFFVFDVLSIDGQDLLQVPLLERKEKLNQLFTDNTILYHSPQIRTTDAAELKEYHELQLAQGLEGVVVKQVNSAYQSGRKGWSWVKIKEAEGQSGKLADTLDLVVMGYYSGRGKRADFGIGAVLVGVYDDKTEKIVTLAKVGSGLKDEMLREIKQLCDQAATKDQPKSYVVNKLLLPDVWCVPKIVIEVAADELTHSPIHSAGIALRFPRVITIRADKDWNQATSLAELEESIVKK